MVKIALCGFSGSGKDTIADILIRHFGYKKLSFAGAVKDTLSSIFGWDRDMLEGITPEDRVKREIVDEWWSTKLGIPGFCPRMAMIQIATGLFRDKFHKDIWTLSVEKKIMQYDNVVITDCRFSNEIAMVKSYGFELIFVERAKPSWFDLYKSGVECEEADRLHESEKSWIREEFTSTIDNNGSIEDLYDTVLKKYDKN